MHGFADGYYCCMSGILGRKFQCDMWSVIFDRVGSIGLLTRSGGRIVGQLIYMPKDFARRIGMPRGQRADNLEATMVISCVQVHPEFRNRGIASGMIREAIDFWSATNAATRTRRSTSSIRGRATGKRSTRPRQGLARPGGCWPSTASGTWQGSIPHSDTLCLSEQTSPHGSQARRSHSQPHLTVPLVADCQVPVSPRRLGDESAAAALLPAAARQPAKAARLRGNALRPVCRLRATVSIPLHANTAPALTRPCQPGTSSIPAHPQLKTAGATKPAPQAHRTRGRNS